MKKIAPHFFITLCILLIMNACEQPTQNGSDSFVQIPIEAYPESYKVKHTDTYFGTEVKDPFIWLEDENSDSTKAWVIAQNDVAYGYLEQIPFRNAINERLTAIWDYPKYGTPSKHGDKYYFYKNDGLQDHFVLYAMDALDAEPKVLLDPNLFSEDGTVSLGGTDYSNDGKYMAYTRSESGSDWKEIYVIDLETGEHLDDLIEWTKFSGASWYKDGFFYGTYDVDDASKTLSEGNDFQKVYYHKLGTVQSEDVLIHEDPNNANSSSYVYADSEEKFLFRSDFNSSQQGNTTFFKSANNEDDNWKPIIDKLGSQFWLIDMDGEDFYAYTNIDAPNYRIVKFNINTPGEENWETIVPNGEALLENVSMVNGKLVVKYLKDVANQITIFNLDGSVAKEIELPTLGTVGGFEGTKDDTELFFTMTSFVYPSVQYLFDMETFSFEKFRESEIDFSPEDYETKQVFVESTGGAKVPVFITHKKGIELDGNNPTMMYGYGGFNISIKPGFSISRIPFLENGGVYASVNLRGGKEYGEAWHEDGMLLNKQNVFDDFINCGEWLIENKYTNSDKLAISGRSNGGLLVGACMTQRPDLFAVAMPAVGVMDMLKYHTFTIGHAWVREYGSSEDSTHFENLLGYSPLHNLEDGVEYPATMVQTADHDDRVVPAHSFKFAARLQEAHDTSSLNPVIIRIETNAGHGAGKPTYKVIEDVADFWTFVMFNLGMEVQEPS